MLLPEEQGQYLLASDAGYGFVVRAEDLQARGKAGKVLLSLPEGARILPPWPVRDLAQSLLAALTADGRLLLFPLDGLPQLAKGKGNRIIGLTGEERLQALAVLPAGASLVVQAGRRSLTLKPAELEHYRGERGRRGRLLPRGFQRVEALTVSG